jgi:flagellar biosynthesis protein FlhF
VKIRQYTAATMQEARLKVKLDLGPNAVILQTRSFKKGGLFGLFGKDMVEILAAADIPDSGPILAPRPAPAAAEPTLSATVPVAPPPAPPQPTAPATPVASPVPAPIPAAPVAGPAPTPAQAPPPPAPIEPVAVVESRAAAPAMPDKDVAELKEAMGEVKRMLQAVTSQLEKGPRDWPEPLARFYDRILASELSVDLAKEFMSWLLVKEAQEPTPELVRSLEAQMAVWAPCSGAIAPPLPGDPKPKIIALVGPTGVGKTTTIAKLAANFRLLHQQDVGLITIDTYRVAAVEQLRTYGDIIGIPVEVVVTPNALRDAIARFSNKGVVLVDTAGRSPSNKMHLHELRGFLDVPQPREVHLVLSATTNRSNLQRITEAFSPVGVDRIIFTKIDESATFGAMVSTAHALGKPVSYLTTGQSVPDDIKPADALAIARLLTDEWLS